MTQAAVLAQSASVNLTSRNRIINGDMRIDQRNAGASVTQTTSVAYNLDRWIAYGSQASKFTVQQNAGSVTPPVGFSNYLGVTSSSAYSVLSGDLFWVGQYIEGFNTADLGWGTSDAKTVTLSFWVRSSLTGTFGGSLTNNTLNPSYPFSYTINAANTWEHKSITIAGDTTGTWVGATNGIGLRLWFSVGMGSSYSGTAGAWASGDYRSVTGATSVVGTSGATFYITGVQLEVGTTASEFEHRLYGQELALCQRYYFKYPNEETWGMTTAINGSGYPRTKFDFKVSMRAIPSIGSVNFATTTGAVGAQFVTTESVTLFANPSISGAGSFGGNWTASAEL